MNNKETSVKILEKALIDNEKLFEEVGEYRHIDKEISRAIKNILEEREQDKKRIKELEADLYSANITIEDLTDSIPRKKVEDKIEELKRLIVQLPVQHMKKAQIAVLQELLEEEKQILIKQKNGRRDYYVGMLQNGWK